MSIRPIDLQMTVSRASEVNRVHDTDTSKNQMAQQQFAEKLQKEAVQHEHQVVLTNKTEGRNVDKDGKGNGAHSNKKDGKQKEKDAQKEKRKPLGILDISV